MLNNISIMGRLTADPELHFSQTNNNAFVTFSIANQRDFDRSKTDFYDCMAFGRVGEFINNFWVKGRTILLKGHLQTNGWTDQNGKKHKDVKIIVDNAYFCDWKNDNQPQNKNETAPSFNIPEDFTEIVTDPNDIPFNT